MGILDLPARSATAGRQRHGTPRAFHIDTVLSFWPSAVATAPVSPSRSMNVACCIPHNSHSVKRSSRALRELPEIAWRGESYWMSKPKPASDPERSKEAVGQRLVILRAALELQAKDMSAAVGVEPNTWSQWEKGKRMADLNAMSRVWDKYGADLNYIFTGRVDNLPVRLAATIAEKAAQVPASIDPDANREQQMPKRDKKSDEQRDAG